MIMIKENHKTNNHKVSSYTTGSKAILQLLIQHDIDTVFGYPGGAIMPLYDALYDHQHDIRHILVRHEQGAIHAAQGYARSSGKVGVVFATSGPGATNLVTGLADAMIDSTPLICITGQVFSHLLGTDAFQETDIISITTSVTKWRYQITDANQIPDMLQKALLIACSGRPGPVLLDISKDAQLQEFDIIKSINNISRPYPFELKQDYPVDMIQIKKAATLIDNAKRPFILFGQGIILGKAESEFKNFVEKSGIPAAATLLGLGALSTDHDLYVGLLGMHGNYAPNKLTNECDVLIAIGMRFDDRITSKLDQYAQQAKVIHIDIDSSEINKNVKAEIPVIGNCKVILPVLTNAINPGKYNGWLQKFHNLYNEEYTHLIKKEMYPEGNAITMSEVIRHLNELTNGESIIVTDVGQHQMVTCRYATFKQSRANITSGGLGTMGFALPAAIGAKLGAPDRIVIAIAGDGGIQMNIQELGTIMQSDINLKIIILNNHYLGMVRQWQELFNQKRYSFVDIQSPDYVAVAKGYGIAANSITQRENLYKAIHTMLHYHGAYLLEIMVDKDYNVFPMVPQSNSVSDVRLH